MALSQVTPQDYYSNHVPTDCLVCRYAYHCGMYWQGY